jgi:hypothetical protein
MLACTYAAVASLLVASSKLVSFFPAELLGTPSVAAAIASWRTASMRNGDIGLFEVNTIALIFPALFKAWTRDQRWWPSKMYFRPLHSYSTTGSTICTASPLKMR